MSKEPQRLRPIPITDPSVAVTWIEHLRSQALDAIAAGDDATRPKNERVLSRAEARRKILEARENLLRLLDGAALSLPS